MTTLTIICATLVVLAAIVAVVLASHRVAQQYERLLVAERERTEDWYRRSQRQVDNLQDRVMSREFETYAQASLVERPGDQPTFTAEGEYAAGEMAVDLLQRLREEQEGWADDLPDLAEDYAGPTIG